MNAATRDLIEEADRLHRRIVASGLRGPAVVNVRDMLAAAIEAASDDAEQPDKPMAFQEGHEVAQRVQLIAARDAFYALAEARQILNEWEPVADRADRENVMAALELASLRRVLSFTATGRGAIPAHEWTLGNGAAPVRVEILEGTTAGQAIQCLQWVLGLIRSTGWPLLIEPRAAAVYADFLAKEDFPAEQRRLQREADGTAAQGSERGKSGSAGQGEASE